jgi:hypothetical protein
MNPLDRFLTASGICLAILFGATSSEAQVSEDFSDFELSANPTWTGTLSTFMINTDTVLQLNDVASGASYLSTSFAPYSLDDVEWQFWVKQSFSGSSSNYGRVYLASSESDLGVALDGYYLQFGEALSNDAIELFHQSGSTSTSVCRGTEALIANSFNFRVRVRRDASGNWELAIDPNSGTDFAVQATGNHTTVTSTTNFGVRCEYTSSNANKFFYDDIYMGPYIVDLEPPTLLSLDVVSNSQLDLTFSEPLEQTAAENESNYVVNNGIVNPNSATLDGADPTLVHLSFTSTFTNGTTYDCTVAGLSDLSSNLMLTTSQPFTYVVTEAATYREVVINEVLADQTPTVGLPEAEFIELHNVSNKFIDIGGWKLGDATSTGTIDTHIIGPGQYAILASTANAPMFGFFGNSVPVTSFPSFNNEGDRIVLLDADLNEIDQLTYDLSWYKDSAKEDGGYSLEQMNPLLSCSKSQNWAASNSSFGGTPNAQNSVYNEIPDTTGPILSSIDVVGPQELKIFLSEPLLASGVSSANILSEPTLAIGSAFAISPDDQDITILLTANIDTGVYYTVHITGLSDCEGNLQSTDSTGRFILPFTADSGDFKINELLFDPLTGGSDYIELVNVTDRPLNMKGWMLATFDEEDGISSHRIIVDRNYAVPPGAYVLIAEDTTNVMTNYIQHGVGNYILADMPSYNNDSGTVYLLTFDSIVAERFKYDDEMHFALLSTVDGVSLERLDMNRSIDDRGNWHSAAQPVGFGTPGLENSQYYPTNPSAGEVSMDPEIFSPDNDGENDFLNINYSFNAPGFVGTIRIYDSNGRPVRQLISNELLATSGVYTWDGTTDRGEKARIGMYVVMFEAFSVTGDQNNYKMSAVLGGRL